MVLLLCFRVGKVNKLQSGNVGKLFIQFYSRFSYSSSLKWTSFNSRMLSVDSALHYPPSSHCCVLNSPDYSSADSCIRYGIEELYQTGHLLSCIKPDTTTPGKLVRGVCFCTVESRAVLNELQSVYGLCLVSAYCPVLYNSSTGIMPAVTGNKHRS